MENTQPAIQLPFTTSHAFVVGINDYQHLTPLSTAVNDARVIAERLADQHGFTVHPPLLNATHKSLRKLLMEDIPKLVGEDDRVLFYFAGHGIALDGEEGPNGYLVAADTRPGQEETLIPMQTLHDALTELPCRHGLLILDCCFSGAFKWSSGFRDVIFDLPKVIYEERFWRYCKDEAWQVITSSAHDQKAVDIITNQSLGLREEGGGGNHSPFASSLLKALAGEGDMVPAGTGDGVMTATEIYSYLRDSVETQTTENAKRQSPSIFNLQRHDKGEFIFLNPNHRFNLPPTPDRNPFMGLSSFNEEDASLFYGRDRVVAALLDKVKQQALLVVSGASGTGKSSVIKAGVLPQLRKQGYTVLPIIRPGKEPLKTIASELPDITQQLNAGLIVLVIDQYEELITQCLHPEDRIAFEQRIADWLQQYPQLRILLSIRSDFEPQFESEILAPWWQTGRYVVPAFSLEEIREVITKPAAQAVLFYEPEDLVEQLSEEVSQAPGALPLLSFTLSELYHKYLKSGREDRALTESDYNELGGVIGALRTRADAEYISLNPDEQSSMRKLMLRMVSLEGGELAGKRVYEEELHFTSASESKRLRTIANRLVDARLLLKGTDGQGRSYIEPAHDALVRAWARLWEWIKTVGEEKITLQYKLSQAVNDYHGLLDAEPKKARNLLWNNNPRLDLLQAELTGKDHGLNAQEETFVRRSVQRRSVRKRTGWAIAVAVMIGLAGLSVFAFAQAELANKKTIEAEENAAEAERQRLTAVKSDQAAQDSAKVAQYERQQALFQADTARLERDNATQQTILARQAQKRAEQKAREALAGALTAQARQIETENPTIALNLAAAALSTFKSPEASLVFDDLWKQRDQMYKHNFKHDSDVLSRALSDNGKYLVTGTEAGKVFLWNTATGKKNTLTSYEEKVQAVTISPDSRFVLSSAEETVLWDVINQKEIRRFKFEKADTMEATGLVYNHQKFYPTRQHFSPDSKYIGFLFNETSRNTNRFRVVDRESGQETPFHEDKIAKEKFWSKPPLVQFSPDNQSVLIVDHYSAVADLWDIKTGNKIRSFEDQTLEAVEQMSYSEKREFSAVIEHLAFSTDGQFLLTSSKDKKVRLWDVNKGKEPLHTFETTGKEVPKISFSPDKKSTYIVIGDEATFQLFDRVSHKQIHSFEEEIIAISKDAKLITTKGESEINLWSLPDNKHIYRLEFNNSDQHVTLNAQVDADCKFILLRESYSHDFLGASDSRDIKLFPLGLQDDYQDFTNFSAEVSSVAFSPDDQFFVTGTGAFKTARDIGTLDYSNDPTKNLVQLWNRTTGALVNTFKGHTMAVSSVTFSPNGKFILSSSLDKSAKLWDQKSGELLKDFKDHNYPVNAAAFSAKGDVVVTASGEHFGLYKLYDFNAPSASFKIWDINNDSIPCETIEVRGGILSLAFSHDDRYILIGFIGGGCTLWDREKKQFVGSFIDDTLGEFVSEKILSVAFSHDDQQILMGTSSKSAKLWNRNTGVIRHRYESSDYVNAVAFSTDNKYIYTGLGSGKTLIEDGTDNTIKLWDRETGVLLKTYSGHSDPVLSIAISSDGQWLLSGSEDKTVKLWKTNLNWDARIYKLSQEERAFYKIETDY